MEKLIKHDMPVIVMMDPEKINKNERILMLTKYGMEPSNFYIFPRGRELIFINKSLENASELKELIEVVMQQKYLNSKMHRLLDEFEKKSSKEAGDILLFFWTDWRKAKNKRQSHDSMIEMLKEANKCHLHRKAQKYRDEIKMAFDIGFGIYEEGAKCDWQKGANNAFKLGYLMALQEREII